MLPRPAPEAARPPCPAPPIASRKPRARERLVCALVVLLLSCRRETATPIHVVVGPAASDEAMFAPRAALAELIEISPSETALFVNLTSSERSCEGAPPNSNEDDVTVSLRLSLPAGAKLGPGSYAAPVAAIDPAAPASPTLTTTVKLHGRRYELYPGGMLDVTEVDLAPQGRLEGLLKLEFPGDAERPSTRVSGRFLAHFCKVNRLR